MSQRPDAFTRLLPLLNLLQQIQQQQAQQADANIARLPAGSTVAQAGLTPKQQKAKYGRLLAPTDVVTPQTAESKSNQMLLDRINSLSPPEVDTFVSSMLSRQAGVPQIITKQGLASQSEAATTEAGTAAKTATTKASIANTTHGMVLEGLASLEKASPEVRQTQGLAAAGLQTPEATEGANLQTRINNETKRTALTVLADPNHPLNQVMNKELGFNAITAAPGIALGMSNLLGDIGQIAYQKSSTSNALEVAKFQLSADMIKQMNDAESNWAKDVATNQLKGTVTPRTVLNWKRWKEAGGDPKQMPAGVSDQLDNILSTSTAIAQRAFVTEQAEKGDPYANAFLKIAEVAGKVNNKNSAEAIATLLRQYYSKIQATQKLGPRPNDPQGQARWDNAASVIEQRMPKLEAKSIFTGGGVSATVPNASTPPALAPAASLPQGGLNIGGRNVPVPPGTTQEDINNILQIVNILGGQQIPGNPLQPTQPPPVNLQPVRP